MATLFRVPLAAPRIDTRLLAALERLEARDRPIAEMHRRLGSVAERLHLPRPSYEQTRVLVHAIRAGRSSPGAGQVLLDIATRARPSEAIFDLLE